MPGASVLEKGTSNGVSTDFDGNYTIPAATGNTLVFSYVGSTSEVDVTNASNISFAITENQLEEVVITALGIKRKKDEITSAYQEVKTEELTKANNPDVVNSLSGKVSGLTITQTTNGVNAESRIVLRGNRSISGNNQALIVIDGAISTSQILSALDPNQIRSINVIKGASGSALYGSQGSNGVIVVTTAPSLSFNPNTSVSKRKNKVLYRGRLKIKNQTNNTDYIKELEKAQNVEQAYKIYLTQRTQYSSFPAYYIDVYDFFSQYKNTDYSLRILTNIAEICLLYTSDAADE